MLRPQSSSVPQGSVISVQEVLASSLHGDFALSCVHDWLLLIFEALGITASTQRGFCGLSLRGFSPSRVPSHSALRLCFVARGVPCCSGHVRRLLVCVCSCSLVSECVAESRGGTQVSCIAGRFLTVCTTRCCLLGWYQSASVEWILHEDRCQASQFIECVFITRPCALLEKAMAPHSSTLAWKIPCTEEPGGLQSMGLWRIVHDGVTSLSLFTFMHWRRKWQPTPVYLPGESQGWGSLVGCHLWGCPVGHDWSDLAAAAAYTLCMCTSNILLREWMTEK